MSDQADIDAARHRYNRARAELRHLVAVACPGPHDLAIHRDMKPPWCNVCGRDRDGLPIGQPKGVGR